MIAVIKTWQALYSFNDLIDNQYEVAFFKNRDEFKKAVAYGDYDVYDDGQYLVENGVMYRINTNEISFEKV